MNYAQPIRTRPGFFKSCQTLGVIGVRMMFFDRLKLAGTLFGVKSRKVLAKHTTWQGTLQVIVLPFEDDSNLETERLERCPNSFAFYDPERQEVNYVPTCAWSQHKRPVMRRIADYYAKAPASL